MADFQLLRDKLASLPVYSVLDAVVRDVLAGSVTVVAARTGSGKSMMLPGALADVSYHQIVVLEPRRFLAFDSAFNVAELAGIKVGDKVGYALGQINGESSLHSTKTKVLYCTYGYAISSGLINKAQTIVLDEVHEADEQISLARAILFERKKADPSLRILEMSATIDPKTQARYWQNVARISIHAVEGKALECDIVHESTLQKGGKERSAEEIAVGLIKEGRKGIVLFRPGVREVENTVEMLKEELNWRGFRDVEVVGIHGGSSYDERAVARSAPIAGRPKIVVGTNVIESGVNLRWLDTGISDGYRKIPYRREDTGADALVREDLPQAGLLQQIGRVNRDPAATGFDRGLFILHSGKTFEARRTQNGPAIQRESLNGIAFYAACLGYDPAKLTWDVTDSSHIASLPQRLEQAKQELMRLQLVHDDWSLTQDGEFIKHLPVSPESGAMLCEARKLDERRMRAKSAPRVMRDAVVLTAIAESHGLCKDARRKPKSSQNYPSDLLDNMNAFLELRNEPAAQAALAVTEADLAEASPDQLVVMQQQRAELQALCVKQNISLNGFMEVARLSEEIASRLMTGGTGIRIDPRGNEETYDAKRTGELQRCILNANVNRLFIYEGEGLRDLLRVPAPRNRRFEPAPSFSGYEISRSSVVSKAEEGTLMAGSLREVQGLPPLTVLTEITVIPAEVFVAWAAGRAEAYQPIIGEGLIAADRLCARYAGKAVFEISLPPKARAQAGSIAEEIKYPLRRQSRKRSRYATAKSAP